jgi:hypothetical protein
LLQVSKGPLFEKHTQNKRMLKRKIIRPSI